MRSGWISAASLLFLSACAGGSARDLENSLATLCSVGSEGQGNAEAARAWKEVVSRGPEAMIPTLRSFEGVGPRAANWLRSAVDAIAERAVAEQFPLAGLPLETFVRDLHQDGRARRLAYEWLVRVDPGAPDRLLPGMLDDPGQELRREAVERSVRDADAVLKAGDRKAAAEAYRRALSHARDVDQVEALSKTLKGLGEAVDLQAHYGVIPRWTLLASFDNTGMKGYDVAYPPETRVDPKAELEGKGGRPVRVVDFATPDPQGKVDLNQALGKEMGSVAYAHAVLESGEERVAEIRVATNNAVKIFLNGELLFFRNEYHHGMKMDQYVGRGRLRRGRNELLLKICQNEQKDDWAQSWSFQGRICDALGTALPVRVIGAGSGR